MPRRGLLSMADGSHQESSLLRAGARDLYLRLILSAFQQSLWVCWHLSKASRVDLEAVCLWAMEPLRCCCSGTRGQPQQGRAGCRAVALLAAGPVANFWCISLKKSHGSMTGMKTNPSMKILSPERIFSTHSSSSSCLEAGLVVAGVREYPAAPCQHLD